MSEKNLDDLYYVCSLLEYIARKTKNRRRDTVYHFDEKAIARQLRLAEVNHCLSFEQVSDELIEQYGIKTGNYDSVGECKYEVPSVTAIGRLYQTLIVDVHEAGVSIEKTLIDVFSSFLSDEISDFNSSIYYRNPDYLRCSYLEGRLLA